MKISRRAALVGSASLVLVASRARAQAASFAVFDGPGVGGDALLAAITAIEASGHRAARVTPDEVRAGALDAHASVLFTGGRGSFQGRALGDEGRARVREAVRAGLGYVGICGGSFLALQGEPEFFKLNLVAARHGTGDAWMRGIGPALLTPEDGSAPVTLHYANGPLFSVESVEGLAPPTVLARYGTEYALPAHDTHPGQMMGAPALLSATFGAGRVVLFSPNPTLDPARDELLIRALERTGRGHRERLDRWSTALG